MLHNYLENLKFWRKAKTVHRIHAPFLFDFAQSTLEDTRSFYPFFEIPKKFKKPFNKTKFELLFKIILFLKPVKIVLNAEDLLFEAYLKDTGYYSKNEKNTAIENTCWIFGEDKMSHIETLLPSLEKYQKWNIIAEVKLQGRGSLLKTLSHALSTNNIKLIETNEWVIISKIEGTEIPFEHVSIVPKNWKPFQLGFFA